MELIATDYFYNVYFFGKHALATASLDVGFPMYGWSVQYEIDLSHGIALPITLAGLHRFDKSIQRTLLLGSKALLIQTYDGSWLATDVEGKLALRRVYEELQGSLVAAVALD